MMKKILALIITVMTVFSLFGCEDTETEYEIIVAEDIEYEINGTVLRIRGNGGMPFYKHCDECEGTGSVAPWSEDLIDITEITEIVIEEGITCVSKNAFTFCSSVEKITLPDSLEIISDCSFYCNNVTSFHIPKGVKKIEMPVLLNADPTEITVDSENKYYCGVDGVVYDKDKTELIWYPEYKEGEEYTIPESVKKIGDFAFHYCENIRVLNIPKNVKEIGEEALKSMCEIDDIYYGGTKKKWKKYGVSVDAVVHCSDGDVWGGN